VAAGVDITVIRSWLGRVSLDTTNTTLRQTWKRSAWRWRGSKSYHRKANACHGRKIKAFWPGSIPCSFRE
jgi:hypothetical protein